MKKTIQLNQSEIEILKNNLSIQKQKLILKLNQNKSRLRYLKQQIDKEYTKNKIDEFEKKIQKINILFAKLWYNEDH